MIKITLAYILNHQLRYRQFLNEKIFILIEVTSYLDERDTHALRHHEEKNNTYQYLVRFTILYIIVSMEMVYAQ
jgi:hypothetical protein